MTENNEDKKKRKVIRRRAKVESQMEMSFNRAWDYILDDVLIPAAKNTISDAVNLGLNTILFGEDGARRRGNTSRSHRNVGQTHVNYNKISRQEPRATEPVRHARRNHMAFDDIILETRGEADDVLETLRDVIDQYDVATVADLYSELGITQGNTDLKWGWSDLVGVTPRRVREGYLLNLPKPEYIN